MTTARTFSPHLTARERAQAQYATRPAAPSAPVDCAPEPVPFVTEPIESTARPSRPTYVLPTSPHGTIKWLYCPSHSAWMVCVYAWGRRGTKLYLTGSRRTPEQTIAHALAWLAAAAAARVAAFNTTVTLPKHRVVPKQRGATNAEGIPYPPYALPLHAHGRIYYVYDKREQRWAIRAKTRMPGTRVVYIDGCGRTPEQSIALLVAWLDEVVEVQL